MSYTKAQIAPLWCDLFMETDREKGDFNGSVDANIIVAIMNLYVDNAKWPTIAELATRLINREAKGKLKSENQVNEYQTRISALKRSGDLIGGWEGCDTLEKELKLLAIPMEKRPKTVVRLAPDRISSINERLAKHGLPELNI